MFRWGLEGEIGSLYREKIIWSADVFFYIGFAFSEYFCSARYFCLSSIGYLYCLTCYTVNFGVDAGIFLIF